MKYRDFAVLYRNHHHRKEVVDELRRRDIPVQVRGADLFDAPQVRDAMAVLRILDGPDPVALFRVAALPQFNVDPERFRAELALAGRDASIEAVLEKVPGGFEVMEAVREARHDLANANGMMPAAIRIMRTFVPDRLTPFPCNACRNSPLTGAASRSRSPATERCANFWITSRSFRKRGDSVGRQRR